MKRKKKSKSLIVLTFLLLMCGQSVHAKEWNDKGKFQFLAGFVDRELHVEWKQPSGFRFISQKTLFNRYGRDSRKTIEKVMGGNWVSLNRCSLEQVAVSSSDDCIAFYPLPSWVAWMRQSLSPFKDNGISSWIRHAADSLGVDFTTSMLKVSIAGTDTIAVSCTRLSYSYLGRYDRLVLVLMSGKDRLTFPYLLFFTEEGWKSKDITIDRLVHSVKFGKGDNLSYLYDIEQSSRLFEEARIEYLEENGYPEFWFF